MSTLLERLKIKSGVTSLDWIVISKVDLLDAIAVIERLSVERVGVDVGIPEGWVLMPKKASATMVYMGCEGIIASARVVERLYDYMVAHRPKPLDAPLGVEVNVGVNASTSETTSNTATG